MHGMARDFARRADIQGVLRAAPDRPTRWQCQFTTACKGKPAIKRNGGKHSMCEFHREYQRVKIAERRATKRPRRFRPTQCRYKPGCESERARKRNGELHNYCEFPCQRQNIIQVRRQARERTAKAGETRSRQRRGGSKGQDRKRKRPQARGPSTGIGCEKQDGEGLESRLHEPQTNTQKVDAGVVSADSTGEVTLGGLAEIMIAEREEVLRKAEADKRFMEKCAAIWAAHRNPSSE